MTDAQYEKNVAEFLSTIPPKTAWPSVAEVVGGAREICTYELPRFGLWMWRAFFPASNDCRWG